MTPGTRKTDVCTACRQLALGALLVLGACVASARVGADESEAGSAPADSTAGMGAEPTLRSPGGPTQANPRGRSVRKVRLIGGTPHVVRAGPGDTYAISGIFQRGDTFPVIAKSGAWYDVQLSDSESGWIHASLCKEFDDLSDLEFRPNPRVYSRTGSFILSGHAGGYAFDRKSNSLVLGGGLGYHVFDRLQVECGVGWTHIHRPAEIVESLFGLSLEAEDFHMLFYHVNATWELLPGRQMVPYVTAGMGSAVMRGESESSFNFGGGTTLYLSKRTAMRWEVRDYRFATGSADARRPNNNIEFTLGSLLLF